jgi:hypothetical protein
VEDLDALFIEVGAGESGAELIDQIPFGVVVFGEDEQAPVRPFRAGLRATIAGQPGARAEVFANPFDEPAHLCIGQTASLIGDALHFVEELVFLCVVGLAVVAG